MKAIWLIPPLVTPYALRDEPERNILACPIASTRLRMGVAALEWKRGGNKNVFIEPAAAGAGRRIDWSSAAICVVPKFYEDAPLYAWRDACVAAKDGGCRLVIDISDYPFAKPPPVPEFYSAVLKASDAVVVNSDRMGELMVPHTALAPVLIQDAILGSMEAPAFAPDSRIELLWFGHRVNFPYLRSHIGELVQFASRRRCRLTVLTQDEFGIRQWTEDLERAHAPSLDARFIPWSLEAMPPALSACDLVILPSDPSDPRKAGASANRLAEALNAGRLPVASPLPSYLPFSEAAWVGQDLVQGIEWALANPGEVLKRIRRGQAMVAERFAAEAVGSRWRELFRKLIESGSP